jgi:hypothetical protein
MSEPKKGVRECVNNSVSESDIAKVRKIYTPLSVAGEEIFRRWNDKILKKKVENFLGDIPDFLKDGPHALMSRDVASPSNEFFIFYDLAKQISLDPVVAEYRCNKFVAKNSNAYHFCRLFFFDGLGKKLGEKLISKKVVNFNTEEGKQLNCIKTVCGLNFVDFHHKLLQEAVPQFNIRNICDFSDWFNRHRKLSDHYYLHYLALFLCHGILFENFLLNKEERQNTIKNLLPSFDKISEIFGIRPLIVPFYTFEDENEEYWMWYPQRIKKIVDKIIKN